jgi:hypothetical protein
MSLASMLSNVDWAAFDAMPSREELICNQLQNWFVKQYVEEMETVIKYSQHNHINQNKPTRLGTVYKWRLAPATSLWNALPGEARPGWPAHQARKPSLDAFLQSQAQAAWKRCDKHKAQDLYDMWNHKCTGYSCTMHGWGDD